MSQVVLVTDYAWPSLDIERKILAEVDADLVVAQSGDEAEIVSLYPSAHAILTNWKRVPRAFCTLHDRAMYQSKREGAAYKPELRVVDWSRTRPRL